MPRRDAFAQGEYYHIYNRGAGREPMFFTPANYEHCLRLVQQHRLRHGAAVIAYCLMPNHYHFLLRQEGDLPLSRFLQVVFNSYVQAVNLQESRTGTLFEGRFRHVHVGREEYVVALCRYIHLNPVKAGIVARPEQWPYSNYLEWVGSRNGTLKDEAFMRLFFRSGADYQRFVEDEVAELRARDQLGRYVWD
ncbi:MAG: transposase [Planctomycetes bacterium]|nr:transposase [Planctomycetota bacterium]